VDVYLNNDRIASEVSYQHVSDFTDKLAANRSIAAGDYNALVFLKKADGTPTDPTKDTPALATAINLAPDSATTLVVTADRLIVVPQNLAPLPNEETFRYTVVNALPGEGAINFVSVAPTTPAEFAPEDRNRYIRILAPAMKYGDVSQTSELPLGTYDVAWEIGGQRVDVPEDLNVQPNNTALVILYPEAIPGTNPLRAEPDDLNVIDRAARPFGSPTHIGEGLFTVYLLPFELVSLLLLVAMVGAIILTREETIRRERRRVVVSKGVSVRRLNQASNPTGVTISENQPVQPNEGAAD
jgi:hypothetical protein